MIKFTTSSCILTYLLSKKSCQDWDDAAVKDSKGKNVKRKQATLKTRKSLTNDFFKRRKGSDDDSGDEDFKPTKAAAKAAPKKAEPTERKVSRQKAPPAKKDNESDDDADVFKPSSSKAAVNAGATERKVSRTKQPKKYIESDDDDDDDYIKPAPVTKKPVKTVSEYDEIPKVPAKKRDTPLKDLEEESDVGATAPKSGGSKSGGSSKRKRFVLL